MLATTTAAPSWKQLLRYVIPAASAMVLFSLYTVIDGILVAHGVSESALTSVNISLPFINVLSGLSILLSMGASTLCAFALGRGKKREAEEIFTQTVVVMVILSAAITVGVLLFTEELALFLGAGPQTLENAVTYLRIVSVFSVCFILSYCLEVMVKVDEMEHVQQVQQKIKDMGFRATSLTDELEAMKETTRMLRLVLGAIGAISMVVAAISITNTMVMAIYERTKEIGIMKVIGASLKDIKGLFLTEAAFIGFSGGIIGIIVSYGASFLVNFVAQRQGSTMQSAIPIWLALGGIAFSTAVGVIAGYLPAKRAMKLSALMAIKTE